MLCNLPRNLSESSISFGSDTALNDPSPSAETQVSPSVIALGSPFVQRPPCGQEDATGPAFNAARADAVPLSPDVASLRANTAPLLPHVATAHGDADSPRVDAVPPCAEAGLPPMPPDGPSAACATPRIPRPYLFSPVYLPTPIGGFPPVHRSDPQSLTLNLHPKLLEDWLRCRPSTSAGVQVYGVGYPSSENAKIITDGIRAALIAITRCHAIEVAAPIAAVDDHGAPLLPLPTTYLAYNIPEDIAARLSTLR